MKLYAISDLHLRHESNREALTRISPHPDDWLIVAGDVGEHDALLHQALSTLTDRFAKVLWVPGNHDLWALPNQMARAGQPGAGGETPARIRGVALYERQVSICRQYGVLTPEDPYVEWPGPGKPCILAPLFLLYDYTFRPDHVPDDQVLAWAAEHEVLCADEALLDPAPYPSRAAWCAARCDAAEKRLEAAARRGPLVLINHWPLRYDLVRLPRIPRFSPWCGTRRTEDWHLRFGAEVLVHGHLHVRGTHYRDGVRCEEVSLGYPRDWDPRLGPDRYLREILPGPEPVSRPGGFV